MRSWKGTMQNSSGRAGASAGRHRYGELYASGGSAAPPKEAGTWSPEAREAARRTYMAGAGSSLDTGSMP